MILPANERDSLTSFALRVMIDCSEQFPGSRACRGTRGSHFRFPTGSSVPYHFGMIDRRSL